MPLGTNVGTTSAQLSEKPSMAVVTTQYKTPWVTIIDNGGLETQDAAAILDPDVQINNSTTHIFDTGGRGSTLHLRMKYDDGLTSITDPVVQVFGRYPGDQWQQLYNKNSTPTLLATIVTAASDVTDATDDYTKAGGLVGEAAFDLDGCTQVIVGVTTVLAATGDATLSTLQARTF